MSRPIVIPPGGGEVVGDSPDRRVEILAEHDALHATWSRYGPGRDGADLHVHREHTDLFYVLEGELTLRLGPEGEETTLRAGTLARMPPLVVHGFRNASDAEVRYLNLHAPGRGFAAFLRGLRDGGGPSYDQYGPPTDGGRPTSEASIGAAGPLLTDDAQIRVAVLTGDGGPAPAPHAHPEHVAAFYVLEGEIVLTTGAGELRAEAGSWVQVPPGLAHAVCSPRGARHLELRAAIHAV